jgi:hypothetical protein
MTVSEQVFEQLCRKHTIPYEALPANEGRKTADYKIRLHDLEAIVEIKQIEAGAHEEELLAGADNDDAPPVASDAHIRIRKQFQHARKQLKNSSHARLPTLFVIYDNTGKLSGMDNEDFLQAMHGNEMLEIKTHRSHPELPRISHFFDSRTAKVRPDLNTSTSCFCRLLTKKDGEPLLYMFHNEDAAISLPRDLARLISDRQFIRAPSKGNEYRTWVEI